MNVFLRHVVTTGDQSEAICVLSQRVQATTLGRRKTKIKYSSMDEVKLIHEKGFSHVSELVQYFWARLSKMKKEMKRARAQTCKT